MNGTADRAPGAPRTTLEQAGASDASLQQVHAVLRREKPEPAEGLAPLPIFLVILISVLVFWGGVYLERYRGGTWNPLVYDHNFRPGQGGAAAAASAPDPMVLGARLFNQQCIACHQANGQGVPGAFPPLDGSEWVIGPRSEHLLPRILLYGLNGPIEVKGNPYNGVMTPFGALLRDNQIAAILTYIRGSWGNDLGPITAEQVAAVRAQYGQRPPWTGPEILAAVADLPEAAPAAAAPAPTDPAPAG